MMTTTQDTFPEIQAATKALEKRIALTETEMAQMKDGLAARKLVRTWRRLSLRSARARESRRSARISEQELGRLARFLARRACRLIRTGNLWLR